MNTFVLLNKAKKLEKEINRNFIKVTQSYIRPFRTYRHRFVAANTVKRQDEINSVISLK